MLVAEELLLLGTDERGRNLLGTGYLRGFVLAGGALTELVQLERLALDARRRLLVVDTRGTGDDLLDDALTRFAKVAGRQPRNTLFAVGRHLLEPLRDRLARAELLVPERARVIDVPGRARWQALPDGPRRDLQEEVAAVVTGRQEPDARTGSLAALLGAAGSLHRVVGEDLRPGMSDRDVKRRGKELGEDRFAVRAVVRAIAQMRAAAA